MANNNETSVLVRMSAKTKKDWIKKKGKTSYRMWIENNLYGKETDSERKLTQKES